MALPESEGKSLLVRLEVMLIFTLVDHKRSLLVDVRVLDLGTDYLITRLEPNQSLLTIIS